MKKTYRLKKKSEIDAVFKPRKAVKNEYFSIYYIPTDQEHFKFALSIGKKYGNAVQRNLIKRRIRMIIHQNQGTIKRTMQFVVVVHPKSAMLTFSQINEQMIKLLTKANIMEKT